MREELARPSVARSPSTAEPEARAHGSGLWRDPEGVYDLNTVANYDPAVIPYLIAAPGSRFDKAGDGAYVRLE